MRADERVVRETERWFLKRGLPHFIADYNAAQDIWTRALPALTLLFLVEAAVNAPNRDWAIWIDVVAVAAAFAILLVAWAAANRLRHRPALARPVDVGPIEVAVFVFVPPIVPLAFGWQVASALVTGGVNAGVLTIVYFATSYGVVPMTRWGLGQLVRQAGTVLNLIVRALPLLLLFVTFLFINTEVWQTASGLTWQSVGLVAALFVLIGTAFAVIRLPRQIGELAQFESWDRAEERCLRSPLSEVLDSVEEPPAGTPPLARRQWGNLGLVVLVSEGIQVVLVTILIFGFFVLFGTLAIERTVIESWLGASPEVLREFHVWGQELVLTRELVHVAAFLAAFSGLYFTVVLLTDSTYRDEFLEGIVGEVKESFAVRAVYLAYLEGPGDSVDGPTGGPSTMSPT